MEWNLVKDDTYYLGRRLEHEARKAADPEKWKAYAELKTLKGSYTLGIHGYLNAANLYEARGKTDQAVSVLQDGLTAAMRADNRDLAVICTYRLAQLFENEKNWDAGIAVCEQLGAFCADKDAHFQAADAFEHAAELMVLAGRKVKDYMAPVEHWEKNIHHWEEHGHDHDAVWSRKHIKLYKKLFGVNQ
ncbi:MAG: hypothetical protein KKE62_11920 [Proteobacteria bacterium]|nr:hypothetical protein [Pseudomonadota bacterium]MBU1388985.1 hypothetical protein [Pseudomonadota bacterium]MBU1543537.1 hypothetical protein [Pseudomonadota bacterium]MBU2480661.1 hypothetical protein [Pseudomonadota bacterium]